MLYKLSTGPLEHYCSDLSMSLPGKGRPVYLNNATLHIQGRDDPYIYNQHKIATGVSLHLGLEYILGALITAYLGAIRI